MSAPSSFAIERARMSCTPPAANGTTMRATDWANEAAEQRTSASERRIRIDANSTLSASKEASMPKAYSGVRYREIRDQAKWEAYAKLASVAMQQAGGRFTARGLPAKVYEKGLNQRTVVVEFDSLAKALAAHDSPGYQEALKALGNGAERDFRIVEGIA